MSTLSRIENATWFYSHRLKLSTSNGSFSKRSSKNKFDQNTGIAFLVWTENILKKELFKKVDANIRISVYSVRGDELLLRPVISYFHSLRFSSIFQHSRWDNSVEKKKNLKDLIIRFSSFFSIPDEITVLKKLERLDLSNNDISGWVWLT